MSSLSSSRQRYSAKYTEICIGNIGNRIQPNDILTHFQKFGNIIQSSFTSPTGGYAFITYADPSMVDKCMAYRRHDIDGRHLYVKRALPVDDEHPRERFETTRDLMIVMDLADHIHYDEQFLTELRDYFSSYGILYACKYCHETNFDYILVQFSEKDPVDRIILDKPHYYNEHQLNVMKYIKSNIELMNEKYSLNEQQIIIKKKDTINNDLIKTSNTVNQKEPICESDLEKEVYRLQNILKKMGEDFALQRKQLENNCSEQLKKLNENTDKIHRFQQDLEQEYTTLSAEFESLTHENNTLNELYLSVELENFEITSYYEQILAEEKAKTIQLEAEYNRKLKTFHVHPCSPFTPFSSKSQS